jgi:drug/metabolite transporter (DMT)-like permease
MPQTKCLKPNASNQMPLLSPDSDKSVPEPNRSSCGSWFLSPFLQIGISVVLAAAAQLFLKLGTTQETSASLFNLAALSSPWVWLGILCMLLSLVSWLYALRSVPLLIAFNLAAATHVIVPIASWLLLGERIPPVRWLGILIVTLGVFVIARPLSRVEERL